MSFTNQYAKPYQRRPLASPASGPRRIVAKFASVCRECKGPIAVGEAVLWAPGTPAVHVECPAVVAPVAPVAPIAQEPAPIRLSLDEVGIYVLPSGDIVKAQANREKTKVYAKRWVVISPERATEAGTRARGEYRYEAGLVNEVARAGRKMSLEEAKAFIIRFGVCCRCGRTLITAKSVEDGIGPISRQYFEAGHEGHSHA